MSELKKIHQPIIEDIKRYEELVPAIIHSQSEYVDSICDYVVANRGKQMRPLLVLLSAALHGNVNQDTYVAAALMELVHTASLVHDDVVDESDIRRGIESVKAKWDSRTAVLIGDYIFARSYHYSIEYGNIETLAEITRSIHEVGEGELMQSFQTKKLTMDEHTYNSIIRKKTASLLGASAAMGAISSGASPAQVDLMREFGESIGMAFQIKDDILDYSPAEITGKPKGSDIREGKINLPLLHTLSLLPATKRDDLRSKLSEAWQNPIYIDQICSQVVISGGLEYAQKQMEGYLNSALDILGQYTASPVLESMELFAHFVISRDK